MSLRILGGHFKNRILKSPSTLLTKPTMSLVRKSVFDICQPFIEQAHFLDLFACSGAMGIEALSRGAKQATFIEKDRKAVHCLRENLKTLGLELQATVLQGDVFSLINTLSTSYQIIYIDPPYSLIDKVHPSILSLLEQLATSPSLLASPSLLFLEERAPGVLSPQNLSLLPLLYKNTRRFGDTLLHQWRKDS